MALGLTRRRLFGRCDPLPGFVVLAFLTLAFLTLSFLTLGASAADAPAGAPNADTPSLHPNVAAAQPADCPPRPPSAEGAPSSIVVELDPDTLWRPRGSEVRFTIRGTAGAVVVKKTRVCFAWSSPDGTYGDVHAQVGSPQVRSVGNSTGAVEYGAVVPGLRRLPNSEWWPRRVVDAGRYVFTGAGTVPVADMIVEVTPADAPPVVIAIQVGVTNALVAWGVVVVVVLLVWAIMQSIAKHRQIKGRNLLLRVISTQDGYASLSQLQIVLWTMVVGLSAIYVMTLSGNLISISDGTLILLGIASGAALVARVPTTTTPPTPVPITTVTPVQPVPITTATPAQPVPTTTATAVPIVTAQPVPIATATAAQPRPVVPSDPITPEWSDLVAPNRQTREIDVTRLQMLAFTLITAAFVVIKVVVDYEIPTIPANFLILMGISNGVYVAGRRLPSTSRDPGTPGG
jgi:hypothetical protein